jgi:hypothetical protein
MKCGGPHADLSLRAPTLPPRPPALPRVQSERVSDHKTVTKWRINQRQSRHRAALEIWIIFPWIRAIRFD